MNNNESFNGYPNQETFFLALNIDNNEFKTNLLIDIIKISREAVDCIFNNVPRLEIICELKNINSGPCWIDRAMVELVGRFQLPLEISKDECFLLFMDYILREFYEWEFVKTAKSGGTILEYGEEQYEFSAILAIGSIHRVDFKFLAKKYIKNFMPELDF